MLGGLVLKKIKLIKLESSDGEVHFQECRAKSCAKAPEYDEEEALNLSKKDAEKPLFLNRKQIASRKTKSEVSY